jgi:hypothetical protein
MAVTINGTTGITTPADTVTTITSPAATALTIQSAGTTAMTIDTSQNVGIGTTSPSYKLSLQDSSNFAIHLLKTGSNDGWLRNIGTMDIAAASGGGGGQCITFSTGANYAGLTERARIDGSGNLLVGTTSTPYNCTQLEKSDAAPLAIKRANSDGSLVLMVRGGSIVGSIAVTTSATSYLTSSDYRLKEDVQPMQNALGVVAQLNPVTYKWKATGEASQGFIAHELQAVVPDCVTGEKDAVDADGNPVYQGIDTSFLVATLTAAIQEQQALITTLTERIAALEAK